MIKVVDLDTAKSAGGHLQAGMRGAIAVQ